MPTCKENCLHYEACKKSREDMIALIRTIIPHFQIDFFEDDKAKKCERFKDRSTFTDFKYVIKKSDEFKAELKSRIQSTKYPQVSIGDLHSVPHYRCPNCHKSVKTYEDSPTYPFCHWCGQALDWSED